MQDFGQPPASTLNNCDTHPLSASSASGEPTGMSNQHHKDAPIEQSCALGAPVLIALAPEAYVLLLPDF